MYGQAGSKGLPQVRALPLLKAWRDGLGVGLGLGRHVPARLIMFPLDVLTRVSSNGKQHARRRMFYVDFGVRLLLEGWLAADVAMLIPSSLCAIYVAVILALFGAFILMLLFAFNSITSC